MASITKDAETLNAAVRKVFGDLTTKGFQFKTASIERTDAIGDYVEALVLNRVTGKSLLFTYVPALIHPEGMTIFLQNSGGDIFPINGFLAHKKVNHQLINSINMANYQGTLEERFEGVLKAAKEIILQYLDSYLFGSEWENIPIQWGDMK